MSLTDLILIRHGQSLANINASSDPDCELSPLGHEQARDLGRRLKSLPLDSFVGLVSPYRRARQTAHYLEQETGLTFRVEEQIREFGARCDIDGACYEAESPMQFTQRMKSFLASASGKLILVSHGSPVAYLAQLANGFETAMDRPIHEGIGNAQFRWISDPTPFALRR